MNDFSPYCSVAHAGKLIACCLAKNIPFYACRYPGESQCRCGVQLNGTPIHEVVNGFNVVPFDVKGDVPAFTICPDVYIDKLDMLQSVSSRNVIYKEWHDEDIDKDTYLEKASLLIKRMREGAIDKVVLSRTITRECDTETFLPHYFTKLCLLYPSAYIFIVSYPGVCGWIGATPEILISSHREGYETMALAGTRRAGTIGDWGEKEKQEQQYVAQYITDILRVCGLNNVDISTYTKVAAQVEHLCTRFDITTCHDTSVRDRLVAALHPTPAVAGTPSVAAMKVIADIENHSRRYYGGYVGERFDDGRCGLYVNLRSMEFNSHAMRLYVGGGLTAQSNPIDEWNETCAKAQTLLSAFQ